MLKLKSATLGKILPLLLYLLPVTFFLVTYLVITVAAEDISQGAGQAPNILGDLIAAFHYNPRLGELYAWPIINIFDYQFSFGLDTTVRLFDVLLAAGILFTLTAIVLGRLPKLKLPDATIFIAAFILIILAPFALSQVFYGRFSFIHNYLPIALFFLVFILPFTLEARGVKIKQTPVILGLLILSGILFGMSSQATPIILILSFVAALTLSAFCKPDFKLISKLGAIKWKLSTFSGVLIALFIVYIIGPGIASHYANDPALNYVSIGSLFTDTLPAVKNLLINITTNGLWAAPYLAILTTSCALMARKSMRSTYPIESKLVIFATLFFIIHTLALSQIQFESIMRITLPAYLALIIAVLITAKAHLEQISRSKLVYLVLAIILGILGLTILADSTKTHLEYREQAGLVLQEIKNHPEQSFCVQDASIIGPESPLFGFRQSNILEHWMTPATVHGKTVIICPSE